MDAKYFKIFKILIKWGVCELAVSDFVVPNLQMTHI